MDGRRDQAPPPARPLTDVASGPEHYLAAELFERMHSTRELVAFLENGSLDGMWIWDLRHPEHVWVTQRFRELLGYGDCSDEDAAALLRRAHPADAAAATAAFERHLADPSVPYEQVVRYRHRDGSTVWMRTQGFTLRDPAGRPARFVGVASDLTPMMVVQEQLAESLRSLEAYSGMLERLDRITLALHELSEPDDVLGSLTRILGTDIGELAALVLPNDDGTYRLAGTGSVDPSRIEALHRVWRTSPPGDADQGPIATVLRTGRPLLLSGVDGADLVHRVSDDHRAEVAANLPTSIICVPWSVPGAPCGAVMVNRYDAGRPPFVDRDVQLVRQVVERHESAHRQLQAQLENQAVSRFRELARSAPMAILQIDASGQCTFSNGQWTALTGFAPEDSLGGGWLDVFDAGDLEELREAWVPARTNGDVLRVEVRIHHRDGRTLWVGGSSVGQYDDDGGYTGALIAVSDMTARKAAEAELTERARVDPLTGGSNRFALFEQIDAVLGAIRDSDGLAALIYLDLDTFKEVNDSLGHEIGDQLLVAVADRLRRVLRGGDTCARVGGDEFVLLLEELSERSAAERVAERIRGLIHPPFEVSGVTIHTTASMGVATVGAGDGVLRADELVRRADRAMYRAKAAGRDRWEVFDAAVDEQVHSESTVRKEIADAIRSGRLVLHHQPIVDLGTGELVGVEALVRIQHPTRGLLPPGRFLDVAERSGQIVAVGEWVVGEATRQLARWHEMRPDLYLALNLSGRQIADGGAADLVLDAVAEHHLRPDRLVVELTETTLIKAIGSAVEAVERIRDAGVRIAIDDFGTGYSSLARLTEIPADVIKLDRSFVVSAPTDPMHAAVISAVMHLAERVGLDVVAEGIETPAQLQTVLELGCHVGQGFLFHEPMPAEELTGLLRSAFVTQRGVAANFRA